MEEKLEYFCECGRFFIIVSNNRQPRKCPRCGRLMYPKLKGEELQEPVFKKKKKVKGLDELEDTVEYEFSFEEEKKRKGIQPYSFKRFIKKLFSLFSFGDYREN